MTFEQVRHRPPMPLQQPRELVVACAPMRSNVNLSTIMRTAGCCGVERMIVCGNARIDRTVARDGADEVQLEVRNSLPPVLRTLRADGYRLVGLEQTTNSSNLHAYAFGRRTALVAAKQPERSFLPRRFAPRATGRNPPRLLRFPDASFQAE